MPGIPYLERLDMQPFDYLGIDRFDQPSNGTDPGGQDQRLTFGSRRHILSQGGQQMDLIDLLKLLLAFKIQEGTIAYYPGRRWFPQHRGGAKNPPSEAASYLADGQRQGIDHLQGGLMPAEAVDDGLLHPAFDLPQVGRLTGEGGTVSQPREPRAKAFVHLLKQLLLRSIARKVAYPFAGQTRAITQRRGQARATGKTLLLAKLGI